LEIDPEKVDAANKILGTSTLAETVDAALMEVVKLRQRRTLVELLFTPGTLELGDLRITSSAWR